MDREEIESRLAPCGLDCSRCVRKRGGEIARLSADLSRALGGFRAFAERQAATVPALAGYDRFEAVLAFLAAADCGGCRGDNRCGIPGCAAKTCAAERGVGFCGECPDFPCGRNAYPEALAARWRAMGGRIAEAGPEAWYREQAGRPRY